MGGLTDRRSFEVAGLAQERDAILGQESGRAEGVVSGVTISQVEMMSRWGMGGGQFFWMATR